MGPIIFILVWLVVAIAMLFLEKTNNKIPKGFRIIWILGILLVIFVGLPKAYGNWKNGEKIIALTKEEFQMVRLPTVTELQTNKSRFKIYPFDEKGRTNYLDKQTGMIYSIIHDHYMPYVTVKGKVTE